MFSDVRCKRACWRGIESGVTTVLALRRYWKQIGATPTVNSGVSVPDADNATITWYAKDYPFAPTKPSANLVGVTTWKGKVIQMEIPVEICVSQIVDEFGQPAQIGLFDQTYYLMYPKSGLIFPINLVSTPYQIVPTILTSEASYKNFSDAPDLPRVSWQEVSKHLLGKCVYTQTL
jgi:hypothetical protein